MGFSPMGRRVRFVFCTAALVFAYAYGQIPTGIQAFHRAGQTFLTWNERADIEDEFYIVYRHTVPITAGELSRAKKIAVVPDSSGMFHLERWKEEAGMTPIQRNFIISDLGPELEDERGLFVYTTQAGEEGPAYYAVTTSVNGIEDRTIIPDVNAMTGAVQETVSAPRPVLVWRSQNGKGRVYTQFMDFKNWNPTFDGYCYNYFVSLPEGYDPSVRWPLYLHLEGWGTRYSVEDSLGTPWDFPAIQIWADEPHQSWYYGFSRDHDYGPNWPQNIFSELPAPTAGAVENFTEQRLLRSIADLVRDPEYRVDTNRIYAYGHSMGASGSLSLGIRYPNIFAAVFCSEPMTDYGADEPAVGGDWIADCAMKFGTKADRHPVVNRGPAASHL
ncbi:MAG: alpha/beta hydrolase-fold protein, partial [Bacteroidota bacterium]|nr:alpha/beta hydrolase-fold protein [Bacteroidota bacterium]